MICRMCLIVSDGTIDIFTENDSPSIIAAIIAQHFWFEPMADDPISKIICLSCWQHIETFHNYYQSIEDAHRKLSERFSVKREPTSRHSRTLQHYQNDTGVQVLFEAEECFEQKTKAISMDHVATADERECHSVVTVFEVDEQHQTEETECLDENEDRRFEENTTTESRDTETVEDETIEALTPRSECKVEIVPELVKDPNDLATERIKENLEEFIKIEPSKETQPNDTDIEKSSEQTELKPKRSERISARKQQPIRTLRKSSRGINKGSTTKLPPRKITVAYRKTFGQDEEKIRQNLKLKCEICGGGSYESFAEVKKHYRDEHKRKGYVICCNKKLYKRSLILDHVNRHLNPELFKCKECNKAFADKQCLKNHMLRHESDDVKPFICEHCPRRYAKQYLLDQHRLIHIPVEDRQHFCVECGKGFPSNNTLLTHHRYVHEKAYGQMCHICAKVIRGKRLFAKHQMEHAGIIEPKVQCNICGAWLKHELSLRKHMSLHTESNIEHACSICGKISPSKSAMRSHMRYAHNTERPFNCSVCKKSFKKALVLKEHMTIHTGEVLYTCPHCPKTFNSSANLHSHRKKVHRKEWEEGRKNRGYLTSAGCGSDEIGDESAIDLATSETEKVTEIEILEEKRNDAIVTVYLQS